MSMSKEIATYSDVRAVLDRVIKERKALIYRLPTLKKAMRWRYRAYHFRTLLRKQEAARLGLKDFQPSTPYDGLQLELIEPFGTICIRFNEVEGELSDEAGQVLSVSINDRSELLDPDQQLIDELREELAEEKEIL